MDGQDAIEVIDKMLKVRTATVEALEYARRCILENDARRAENERLRAMIANLKEALEDEDI